MRTSKVKCASLTASAGGYSYAFQHSSLPQRVRKASPTLAAWSLAALARGNLRMADQTDMMSRDQSLSASIPGCPAGRGRARKSGVRESRHIADPFSTHRIT